MSKYEFPITVGNKYFVKPWGMMEKEYGLNVDVSIDAEILFTKFMEKQLDGTDRIVTITKEQDDCYEIDQTESHIFCREHLLGPAFEWGEEAEFSNDGVDWEKEHFLGIAPGDNYPYSSKAKYYHYARPLQKEKDLSLDILTRLSQLEVKQNNLSVDIEEFRKVMLERSKQ